MPALQDGIYARRRLGPRFGGIGYFLTACVTYWQAGRDNAQDQDSAEVKKTLENAACTRQSGACCLGQL